MDLTHLRLQLKRVSELTVACPSCGAAPRVRCSTPQGRDCAPHPERRRATVRHAVELQRLIAWEEKWGAADEVRAPEPKGVR